MRLVRRAPVRATVVTVAVALVAALLGAGTAGGSTGADATLAAPRAVKVLAIGPRRGTKALHPGARGRAAHRVFLHSSATTGAVTPHPKVYVVFWGSQWAADPDHARPALTAFFAHLYGPSDKWGMVLDQYCEGLAAHTVNCGSRGQHVVHPTSSPLGGTWLDNARQAPSRATQAQIAAEAAKAAAHFGNTTQAKNVNAIYVIASAHGTHPDGFPNSDFCAWHNVTKTSAGSLGYTNLPYVPDLGPGECTTLDPTNMLDGYFSTESHEYAESVTNIWRTRGWFDTNNDEIADLCQDLDGRETLGGVSYDVQGLWSNATMSCRVK
jgi:serine protease